MFPKLMYIVSVVREEREMKVQHLRFARRKNGNLVNDIQKLTGKKLNKADLCYLKSANYNPLKYKY